MTVTTGIGPKIRVAPVGSALLSSVRSRDPRLARQQQQQQQQNQINQQNPNINSTITPSQLNSDFNPTVNKPIQLTSVSSSYSDINNVIPPKNLNQLNKNQLPKIPKFSRQQQQQSTGRQSPSLIPRQQNIGKKILSQNSTKSSSPSKSTTTTISVKSRSRTHQSSKSSSSSASSKSKSDHRSTSDEKKRERRKRSPSPSSSRHNYEKSPKRNSDEHKSKRAVPILSSKFREIKKSTKDRNYIRKNRSETKSPSPKEAVLRSVSQPKEMNVIDVLRKSPHKTEIHISESISALKTDKSKIYFLSNQEIVHILLEVISNYGKLIGIFWIFDYISMGIT